MKNNIIHSSMTYKLLTWLLVGDDSNYFKKSKIIKIFNRIDNRKTSIALLMLSFVSLWYESFFTMVGIGFVEGYNLAFLFLVGALFFCEKKNMKSSRPAIWLLFFILIAMISGLWAGINGLEFKMLISGIVLFSQFVIGFIVASTYKKSGIIQNTLLILSTPAIMVGIIQGLFMKSSSLWVSSSENLIESRAFGFFGSPNILGSVLMLLIIMAVFRYLKTKNMFFVVYSFAATIALIMTFSRSAWMGLFFGLLLALLVKNWRYIAIAPVFLLTLLVPSIRQRLLTSVSPEYSVDSSLDGRIWAYNNAIEIFRSSPIIGTGPGTYGGQTAIYYNSPIYLRGMQNGYIALPYTDNQWVQVLTQTGILGVFVVILFFASYLTFVIKKYIKSIDYFYLGLIAAVVAILINGMFANIWEFGAVSVLSGVYLGLGMNYEK